MVLIPVAIEASDVEQKHLPTHYNLDFSEKKSSDLLEKKHTYNQQEQVGFVHDILSPDGIHFRHSSFYLNDPCKLTVSAATPFYHLCFAVRNNSTYRQEASLKPFASFGNHEYNVLYIPHQQVAVEWAGNHKVELYELNLSQQLVESYIPKDHPYLQKIKSGNAAGALAINPSNIPMTPQLTSILLDVLNCPLKGYYKRLFLKAKVFELLSLLFSEVHIYEAAPDTRNTLSDSEIQKMQQAREILHSNLQSPCSLIDLAHQVGTNENYLKKHFKQLYGNTVFGYIQNLRMQQAKTQLVQNEEMHRIAKAVGYKNVHHFSVAFKKYFGYSPHFVRNGSATFLNR